MKVIYIFVIEIMSSKQQKQKNKLFKKERDQLTNIPYSTRLPDYHPNDRLVQWSTEMVEVPSNELSQRRVYQDHYQPNYVDYNSYQDSQEATQWEISEQMAHAGSTLPSLLASCGVLGCIGLGSYFLGRHHGRQENNYQIKKEEEDQVLDYIEEIED